MDFGGRVLDMHSSTSPTFNSALSRYETDSRILDGPQFTLEGEERKCGAVGGSALREIWRRVCADRMTWL